MRGTKHILSPLDQILDFTEGESFKKSCSTIQQFGICEYKMEREPNTEIFRLKIVNDSKPLIDGV